MYIKNIDANKKLVEIAIPITKGTGKARIKIRNNLNEYGLPFASRTKEFSQNCYIEWQIGYDLVKKEKEKLNLTTLENTSFIGANNKEKALYELSEYIYYFYKWNIISTKQLLDIKEFLNGIKKEKFIEYNDKYNINRNDLSKTDICNIDFLYSKVSYPLLIYKFDNSQIIIEIIIKEKQYAIGVQPMLYLCFPITDLKAKKAILGRTAEKKEEAIFIIDESKIKVFFTNA